MTADSLSQRAHTEETDNIYNFSGRYSKLRITSEDEVVKDFKIKCPCL